jgi:cytochrome c2
MSTRICPLICLLTAALIIGCDGEAKQNAIASVGGEPDRGKELTTTYGCIACHTIPGIHGANALVGPPLDHMRMRSYVGGVMQNTPTNMINWLQDPPAINPKTAMPDLHVTSNDARDIATYLYTLR